MNDNVISMGGSENPTQYQTDNIKNLLRNNTQFPIFRDLLFNAYDIIFMRIMRWL